MNFEQFVHMLEVLHRKCDALVPDADILPIAGLEFDQLLPARFAHSRITGRFFVRFFVNADDFGERVALERLSI